MNPNPPPFHPYPPPHFYPILFHALQNIPVPDTPVSRANKKRGRPPRAVPIPRRRPSHAPRPPCPILTSHPVPQSCPRPYPPRRSAFLNPFHDVFLTNCTTLSPMHSRGHFRAPDFAPPPRRTPSLPVTRTSFGGRVRISWGWGSTRKQASSLPSPPPKLNPQIQNTHFFHLNMWATVEA